jgi:hypothetical protein
VRTQLANPISPPEPFTEVGERDGGSLLIQKRNCSGGFPFLHCLPALKIVPAAEKLIMAINCNTFANFRARETNDKGREISQKLKGFSAVNYVERTLRARLKKSKIRPLCKIISLVFRIVKYAIFVLTLFFVLMLFKALFSP